MNKSKTIIREYEARKTKNEPIRTYSEFFEARAVSLEWLDFLGANGNDVAETPLLGCFDIGAPENMLGDLHIFHLGGATMILGEYFHAFWDPSRVAECDVPFRPNLDYVTSDVASIHRYSHSLILAGPSPSVMKLSNQVRRFSTNGYKYFLLSDHIQQHFGNR